MDILIIFIEQLLGISYCYNLDIWRFGYMEIKKHWFY